MAAPSLPVSAAALRHADLLFAKRETSDAAREAAYALLNDNGGTLEGGALLKKCLAAVVADPYGSLGIEPGADESAIKKAYRKLALKYHPDKNDKTTALFQAIKTAYDKLLEPGGAKAAAKAWEKRKAACANARRERATARFERTHARQRGFGGGGVARGGHLGGARRRDARGFQVGAFERLARIVQLRLEVFDPRGERLRLRERRGGRERHRLRLRRVARALRLLGARRRCLRRRRRLGELSSQRGERVVSVVRAPRERRDARLGVRQRALRVVQRRRRRIAPTLSLLGARRGRLRRVQRVVALEHQARAHELRLAFRLRHGHLAGKHGVFR